MKKSSTVVQALSVQLEKLGEATLLSIVGGAKDRQERVTSLASLQLIKKGTKGYSNPCTLNQYLPPEWRLRSEADFRELTGGLREIKERIKKGGVIPVGSLGKWTPDFWSGLIKSGAFKKKNQWGGFHTAPLMHRPALERALTNPQVFHCSIAKKRGYGGMIYISSLPAGMMGADNPGGIGVLVGMLAGSRVTEMGKYLWLSLPDRGGHAELLDSFGIPYIKQEVEWKREILLVSPFWGALLSVDMPKEFREWFDNWEGNFKFKSLKPGMCPLLPWVFLREAWGFKGRVGIPKRAVPFLLDSDSLWLRYDIPLSGIRERGFRELGFHRVDPRVRGVWLRRMVDLGIREGDFPRGKIPLDFSRVLCHDGFVSKGGDNEQDQ